MATKGKPAAGLIPALGYLRKSTKGEKADGKKRQEKSIGQQKTESTKLAQAGGFEVLRWFVDEGISGWKRGNARPDFQRMLTEAKALGAQAVIVDNIDRFSRATVDEVQADAAELRRAGVRWIVTASHGTYDLGKRNDIGEILKFVVAVWSAHEFSRQLSRRISLHRRNAAAEGKRSGSPPPYAWKLDGKGGLVQGDKAQVKIVRYIFQAFADGMSLNAIAADLNARKVPSPAGKLWQARTLAAILRNPIYKGAFQYNANPDGQFFRVDEKGEVVEKEDLTGKGKLYFKEGVYPAMVDAKLWDKCAKRLAHLSANRSARKASYALSGILFCGHCGCPMFGSSPKDSSGPGAIPEYGDAWCRLACYVSTCYVVCGRFRVGAFNWQYGETRCIPIPIQPVVPSHTRAHPIHRLVPAFTYDGGP